MSGIFCAKHLKGEFLAKGTGHLFSAHAKRVKMVTEPDGNIVRIELAQNAPCGSLLNSSKIPSSANQLSIVPNSFLTNRRCFLLSAASGAALVGCGKSGETAPAQTTAPELRRDVPLRVLLCFDDRWAEILKTAWSAIADQPLQISVLDSKSIAADQWQSKVIEAMQVCDVAIIPNGLLPAIDDAMSLVPPGDDTRGADSLDGNTAASNTFFPVLREGLMKFGGRVVAVPLGAVQPSLVQRTDGPASDLETPKDWDAFIALAKKLNESKPNGSSEPVVAEPLADGAAAKMFLWRANSASPPIWLFNRETFAPVIDTEPYVDALETMKRCVELYGEARLTAGEVWSRVATGKLRMAIAWPATHSATERIEEAVDCAFSPLPIALTKGSLTEQWRPAQTLVDIESPVAILSSQCRQSVAAKRFLNWIVGGEGTSMIRSVVTGLTDLRRSPDLGTSTSASGNDKSKSKSSSVDADSKQNGGPRNSGEPGSAGMANYRSVLANSLSSLSIRTPTQLLEYREYNESLDAAVLSCLNGKQSAQAALTDVAKKWGELTSQIGIKQQTKAWRKAQGFRS